MCAPAWQSTSLLRGGAYNIAGFLESEQIFSWFKSWENFRERVWEFWGDFFRMVLFYYFVVFAVFYFLIVAIIKKFSQKIPNSQKRNTLRNIRHLNKATSPISAKSTQPIWQTPFTKSKSFSIPP